MKKILLVGLAMVLMAVPAFADNFFDMVFIDQSVNANVKVEERESVGEKFVVKNYTWPLSGYALAWLRYGSVPYGTFIGMEIGLFTPNRQSGIFCTIPYGDPSGAVWTSDPTTLGTEKAHIIMLCEFYRDDAYVGWGTADVKLSIPEKTLKPTASVKFTGGDNGTFYSGSFPLQLIVY